MTTYPDDADGEVLADLAAQGVDMTQPLDMDFPVDAPDEDSANAINAALVKAGYTTEVVFDEGEADEDGNYDPDLDDEEFGPAWTVYVHKRMVPEYAEIMRIQAELDGIAQPLGGHSDGWGVMLDAPGEEEEDYSELMWRFRTLWTPKESPPAAQGFNPGNAWRPIDVCTATRCYPRLGVMVTFRKTPISCVEFMTRNDRRLERPYRLWTSIPTNRRRRPSIASRAGVIVTRGAGWWFRMPAWEVFC